MKFPAALLLLLSAVPVLAQEEPQERERIAREKAAAEERFAAQEIACRRVFAVNDCVEKARRSRNATLADLRRQELVLNEADRRRSAAERQRELDEKNSPQRLQQEEERRAKALEDSRQRQQEARDKAAARAADQAARAANPREAKTPKAPPAPQGSARQHVPASGPDAATLAANRAKYEQRQREAAEHRKAVAERNAKRTKPAASALPPPRD